MVNRNLQYTEQLHEQNIISLLELSIHDYNESVNVTGIILGNPY